MRPLDKSEVESRNRFRLFAKIFSVLCLALLGASLWACPHYKVWQSQMSGKAEFVRAEQNRRILIEEAKAKLESSKLHAESEIERAKGVAKANEIIGNSLKDNESYLRYLWIQGLNDGTSEVIYVPTEANLPILEAGKRK